MYNGTISLGDAADLNILKQQVELIAALNGQLKEFASLKSNVSAVFDIIKMKTPSITDAAKAVKETASAGNELNLASQTGAALMSNLAENTELCTDAVTAAAGANQSLNNTISISAIQITALIIAITAVVAAITTLGKILKKTNEAGEVAKASAEGLVSAHEKLSETVTESAAAYNRTTAALDAAKDMAHTLTTRLEELQANTARTEAEQAEMARITGELTDKYSGLNGMIDENTGALAGNAEQWNAVMNTWIRMQKACRNGGFPFRQALV